MMKEPPNIALFGGTFDPVHNGHIEIAQKAVDFLALDQVIFIPCRQSPHKNTKPGASDQQRLKMLQLACKPLPWAQVSDYELTKPPPSYTWESARYFRNRLGPKARLFLLIGHDQWEALPRWSRIEALARELEFIVVGRGQQPRKREGYRAHFIHGDHPASASQIRADLEAGRPARWLSPAVSCYLSEKAPYSRTP